MQIVPVTTHIPTNPISPQDLNRWPTVLGGGMANDLVYPYSFGDKLNVLVREINKLLCVKGKANPNQAFYEMDLSEGDLSQGILRWMKDEAPRVQVSLQFLFQRAGWHAVEFLADFSMRFFR